MQRQPGRKPDAPGQQRIAPQLRVVGPRGNADLQLVQLDAVVCGVGTAQDHAGQIDELFIVKGVHALLHFGGGRGADLRSGAALVPGDFLDESGRVLGRHRGLPCYTPGQRKGLGVSAGEPVYVLRKEAEGNRIVLGPDTRLYTTELTAERVNWLSVSPPEGPLAVTAKTRYTQREAAATAEVLPDGRLHVTFQEPQRAVTAGQAVVLYAGEAVAGGGTIC